MFTSRQIGKQNPLMTRARRAQTNRPSSPRFSSVVRFFIASVLVGLVAACGGGIIPPKAAGDENNVNGGVPTLASPPTITGAAAQANGTVVVSGTSANNANIKITWPDNSTTLLVASGIGSWSANSSNTYAAGTVVKANTYNNSSSSALVSATITAYAAKFTDTGVTASQCYGAGSDTLISCTSSAAISLNSQQDGMVGRDVTNADNSDGKLGLSYSRVGSYALTECVKDNITGLMWEGKPASGSGVTRGNPALDPNGSYTNYHSSYYGTQVDMDATTNTYGYVNAVNARGLCGYSDWRLPTADELQSIVDYSVAYPGPTVDGTWFPNTPSYSYYWTSSPYVGGSYYAWGVAFGYGLVSYNDRGNGYSS